MKPPETGLDDPDQNGAQPLSDGSVDIASQPSGSDQTCKPEAVENAYIGRKNRLIPGLHVVATPIGNLGDITDRARQTLAGAAVVACEDTRVTGLLLRHLGLSVPMLPYHEHNADRVRPQLMARLAAGEVVALVSDAGTPLISDPGFKLVREVRAAGHAVVPVPGASALLSALVSAGLPTDRFMFAGFLPQKSKARRDTLDELKAVSATLIFYESTRRLPESLSDMAATLGAGREAAVCRELTKLHEEVRSGTLESLAAHYADRGPPKGEAVVVIGPPLAAPPPDADDLDSALRAAFAEGLSVRDATAAVVTVTGLKKKQVYSRALELHDQNEGAIGGEDAP